MKKLLIFLALFGSGMGVLLWIESTRRDRGPEPPLIDPLSLPDFLTDPDSRGPTAPPSAGPGEPGAGPSPVPQGPVLSPSGVFSWYRRDPLTRRPQLDLVSQDSELIGEDRYELREVEIHIYDRETSEVTAVLLAETGQVRTVQGATPLQLQLDETLVLHQVEAQVMQGLPFPELTMRTANLTGNMAENHFWTEDPASMVAEGLDASGRGLDALLSEGRVSFLSRGRAEFQFDGESTAVLTCDGPLSVDRREVDGRGLIHLLASEKARLGRVGEGQLSRLGADEIDVYGREDESQGAEPQELGIERVEAHGGVVFISDAMVFRSDEARLFAGEGGQIDRGELEGRPRAVLQLASGVDPLIPGAAVEGGPIEIVGSTTMSFSQAQTLELHVPGPAEILWAGARLTARGGVSGDASEDGTTAHLEAWQDVRLVQEGSTLKTPRLVADFAVAAQEEESGRRDPGGAGEDGLGEIRVTAVADPPARIEGRTDEGDEFDVETRGELGFDLAGERWQVPSAQGVTVVLKGAEGFTAEADEVTDFDPTNMAFEALGNVDISGVWDGEPFLTTGQHLVSSGAGGDFVLVGELERPAWFQGTLGSGTALRVERKGDFLFATGDVVAGLREDELDFDLRCDSLESQRFTEPDEQGLVRRHYLLHAQGSVHARVQFPSREFDLESGALDILRTVWQRPDVETLTGRSTDLLVATEVERCQVQLVNAPGGELDSWEITCSKLEANREENDEGLLTREDLLATVDVRVQRTTPGRAPFEGRGDALSLDSNGRGRLYRASPRRVVAEGLLPGSLDPFEITANWIELDETSVRASFPVIDVVQRRVELDEELGTERILERPMRATAKSLVATERSVQLSGNVHLEGELSAERPWQLDSAFARIAGLGEQEGLPARAEQAGAGSIHAWGGFVFHMGAGVTGSGESLTAIRETGLIYLEGPQTILELAGYHFESRGMVFDSVHYALLKAGRGKLTPPGRGERPAR